MKIKKILWICHEPLRLNVLSGKSSSGFWKESLFALLNSVEDLILGIATPAKSMTFGKNRDYTFYFKIKKRYQSLSKKTVRDLQQILIDFQPDLIHVHGTEMPYSLIVSHTNIPVIVSLQGFISESFNAVLGEISLPIWRKETTIKEYVFKSGFIGVHNNWFYNSKYEIESIKKNCFFIGRTKFDKHIVFKHNPRAFYYSGNELLRDEFYKNKWTIKDIRRHTIFTSSFSNPLKGFHVLLEALTYLIDEFPDVQISITGNISDKMTNPIFGNAYYRYIQNYIQNNNLAGRIEFLGKLDDLQICKKLIGSNVFVLPSFIENSSNALGEAQIVGTPCILSSFCGGLDSLVIDYENGLFFRRGDAYDLSLKIRELFLNDDLAVKLSINGSLFGESFHSKENILNQYLNIYNLVYEHHH